MAIPLLLCGIGVLFAMCAACFYRMGAADWTDEKKFLIDSLESLESENAKLRDLMYERAHVYAIQHMTEAELRIVATNVMEDNAKLRELVCHLYEYRQLYFKTGIYPTDHGVTEQRMRELGVEVD